MLLILLSNIVEHCRFNNKGLDNFVFNDKRLDFFYLTTIVTMVNNIINDNHGSIGNVAYPIVEHCRTLSF